MELRLLPGWRDVYAACDRMRPLLLLLLVGCAHTPTRPVTAGARASLSAASTASSEAVAASERSSAHLKAVRGSLSTIDYKAQRALQILNR